MIVAGADPGAEGAVALLDAETCRVMAIIDMPMSGRELRVRELALDLMAALDGRPLGHLWIERQAAFAGSDRARRMGSTSAFAMGQRYMAIKAIAACYGWPYEIVAPQKWKGHFGIRADKALALDCAGRLLPGDVGLWTPRRGFCSKAASIGRAESALIALYGIRILGQLSLPEGIAHPSGITIERAIS